MWKHGGSDCVDGECAYAHRNIRSQSTLLKYQEKIEYVKVKVEINIRHALLSDSENGDCWKLPEL